MKKIILILVVTFSSFLFCMDIDVPEPTPESILEQLENEMIEVCRPSVKTCIKQFKRAKSIAEKKGDTQDANNLEAMIFDLEFPENWITQCVLDQGQKDAVNRYLQKKQEIISSYSVSLLEQVQQRLMEIRERKDQGLLHQLMLQKALKEEKCKIYLEKKEAREFNPQIENLSLRVQEIQNELEEINRKLELVLSDEIETLSKYEEQKKMLFLQAASEEEIFDYAKSVINAHLLEKSFKQMLKDSYLNHFWVNMPLTLQQNIKRYLHAKRKEYVQFLLDKHKKRIEHENFHHSKTSIFLSKNFIEGHYFNVWCFLFHIIGFDYAKDFLKYDILADEWHKDLKNVQDWRISQGSCCSHHHANS